MLEPKLVWASAILMLAVMRLEAQTNLTDGSTNPVDTLTNVVELHTNIYLVFNASFRLTAEVQATPEKVTQVTITTRDLIQAIGAATGNSFSHHARLLWVFRDLGGVPFFVIRDGTNEVSAGGFLTSSQNSTPLTNFHYGLGGQVAGMLYCEEGFRLVNLEQWGFDVQGFNTAPQTNYRDQGELLPRYGPTQLQIRVNGPGTVGGKPAVIQGLVLAVGRKLELRVDELQP